MEARSGIIAGGNWITDHVKLVEAWPEQDTLVSIVDQATSNGGSPYNILKNLALLGAKYPLAGVGLVGADADGSDILADCRAHGIDIEQLRVTPAAATSYTDVMTVKGNGRRTFFHQRGVNALLAPEHFDFASTRARHFHLGYLLLLDQLDQLADGQPRAIEVLQRARAAGLTTSVDCVSEAGARFRQVVIPLLPSVDVLFANDFETEKIADMPVRRNGKLDAISVGVAARRLLRGGPRQWVVIHGPEAVYACSSSGEDFWQGSVRVDGAEIAGAAGAGDALAAGVLHGLHEGWSMPECLRLGVSAAAMSLLHPSCSGGLRPLAATSLWAEQRGFLPPPS